LVLDQVEDDVHVHLGLEVLLEIYDESGLVLVPLQFYKAEDCPKHKWRAKDQVIKPNIVTVTLIEKLESVIQLQKENTYNM
jgi:hypothetical protein